MAGADGLGQTDAACALLTDDADQLGYPPRVGASLERTHEGRGDGDGQVRPSIDQMSDIVQSRQGLRHATVQVGLVVAFAGGEYDVQDVDPAEQRALRPLNVGYSDRKSVV